MNKILVIIFLRAGFDGAFMRQIVQTEALMASTTHVSNNSQQIPILTSQSSASNNSPLRRLTISNDGGSGRIPSQITSTSADLEFLETDTSASADSRCEITFLDMRADKDSLYEQEKAVYDDILHLTPHEYKEKMKDVNEAHELYSEKVDQYVRQQHRKMLRDYDAFPAIQTKAMALIDAEKDGLLTFSVPRFASSVEPGKPSRLSQGKETISREKLIWDLHTLYDELLANEKEYKRADRSLTRFLENTPDYKDVHDSAPSNSREMELIQRAKALKQEKTLLLVQDAYYKPVSLSDVHARKSQLRHDLSSFRRDQERRIPRDFKTKSTQRKAYTDLDKSISAVKEPSFNTKAATPHEAAALKRIDMELTRLNGRIEKGKRTEGTVKYKAARARHNVTLPQRYVLNPQDHESLRLDKTTYNNLQQTKVQIQDGIGYRKDKDAALVKLTGSTNKVQAAFDSIKKLSRG